MNVPCYQHVSTSDHFFISPRVLDHSISSYLLDVVLGGFMSRRSGTRVAFSLPLGIGVSAIPRQTGRSSCRGVVTGCTFLGGM